MLDFKNFVDSATGNLKGYVDSAADNLKDYVEKQAAMTSANTVAQSKLWNYNKTKAFREYIRSRGDIESKDTLDGNDVKFDEKHVSELVQGFEQHFKAFEEEEAFLKAEEQRILEEASHLPITSGTNFEGYRITRYGGYASGDEVVLLSDSWFKEGFSADVINNAIKKVRSKAINELKVCAAEMGCNAVIALDFDYVTVDRQRSTIGNVIVNETYVILTANGTAVEIEPL